MASSRRLNARQQSPVHPELTAGARAAGSSPTTQHCVSINATHAPPQRWSSQAPRRRCRRRPRATSRTAALILAVEPRPRRVAAGRDLRGRDFGGLRRGRHLDRHQHGMPGKVRFAPSICIRPAGRMEDNSRTRTCGRDEKREVCGSTVLLPAREGVLKHGKAGFQPVETGMGASYTP